MQKKKMGNNEKKEIVGSLMLNAQSTVKVLFCCQGEAQVFKTQLKLPVTDHVTRRFTFKEH